MFPAKKTPGSDSVYNPFFFNLITIWKADILWTAVSFASLYTASEGGHFGQNVNESVMTYRFGSWFVIKWLAISGSGASGDQIT